MVDTNQITQALETLMAHDAASRVAFNERSTIRAWTRTEARRRYHFDIDIAAIHDAVAAIRDLFASNG